MTTRRVKVHGVELALEDHGSGPVLLLVHGYPLDHTMWRQQLNAFPGWRTLAPDLRGFGRSTAPDIGYSMAAYADDLVALLDALGVGQAVLVALSMGGYVAFETLRRHRERIRALVLADTRAQPDTPEGRQARDASMLTVRERGAAAIADAMLPRLVGQAASAGLREELRTMMAAAPVAGIAGALAAMRDRPDSRPLLPTLADLPTLVVVGAEDALTPPPDSELMARGIPGARFVVLTGAAHLTPMERPEAFNREVAAFLAEVGRGPAGAE